MDRLSRYQDTILDEFDAQELLLIAHELMRENEQLKQISDSQLQTIDALARKLRIINNLL